MTTGQRSSSPFLVTVSGQDGPGIAERMFAALAEQDVEVDDVEQVRVHGRLLLCIEADIARRRGRAGRAALVATGSATASRWRSNRSSKPRRTGAATATW